jgi:glycosyltransferase involved in cell wall biosynthesis
LIFHIYAIVGFDPLTINNMVKPLITIAIPTYKRLHYLKDIYSSILQIKYPSIEIIISLDVDVNTNNPDKEILDWLIAIQKSDKRIFSFVTERNKGLSNNWNFLVEKARGEYIMILGDDDRLLPNTISELYEGIVAGADISFSNHYLIDKDGNRLPDSESNTKKFNRHLLQEGIVENIEKYIWLNAVPISASLIRTDILKQIGFPADMNTPEIVFFLKAAQANARFYFSEKYLVEYRVHAGSATSSGLYLEKLFECLQSFPVSSKNSIYKRQFLQHIIGGAFYRYLKIQQPAKAWKLFFNQYYPKKINYLLSFGKQLMTLMSYYIKH